MSKANEGQIFKYTLCVDLYSSVRLSLVSKLVVDHGSIIILSISVGLVVVVVILYNNMHSYDDKTRLVVTRTILSSLKGKNDHSKDNAIAATPPVE